MRATWLHREGGPRVLVFFAGWAMDENPFRRLRPGDRDVLVFHDFRRLDEVPYADEIAACPQPALAAWSLGCAAANAVCAQRGWSFARAVAISGTVIPEDDEAGIPARWIAATAANLESGGWARFVRRVCSEPDALASFQAHAPRRELREAIEELEALRRLPAPASCVFNAALVPDGDRCIRPANQARCWRRYGVPVRAFPGGHYPFHRWASWEEVLSCGG